MGSAPAQATSPVLKHWNELDTTAAAAAILPCCGSQAWADTLADRRPYLHAQSLLAAAKDVWYSLGRGDWQEAFDSHPRIGERKPQSAASSESLAWSAAEQGAAMTAEQADKSALRDGNLRYEQRFGRIFIVCARGRSAREILTELERRLGNAPEAELLEAAREQAQITELRLKQWLWSAR